MKSSGRLSMQEIFYWQEALLHDLKNELKLKKESLAADIASKDKCNEESDRRIGLPMEMYYQGKIDERERSIRMLKRHIQYIEENLTRMQALQDEQ